jgi:hypothetical protein
MEAVTYPNEKLENQVVMRGITGFRGGIVPMFPPVTDGGGTYPNEKTVMTF